MADFPGEAVSFEIIDTETGNTIASFEDPSEAEQALARLVRSDPPEAEGLALVAFDKAGRAVGSEPASRLLVS